MNAKLNDFFLGEGIRQDALIHDLASQLGTKTGLYMVFAGFVFTAETALLKELDPLGLHASKVLLISAIVLSLIAIVILLSAAFVQDYKTPPILAQLREQSELYLNSLGAISHDEQLNSIKEKFINSLARSIDHNYGMNQTIAQFLEKASLFIGLSIFCVLVAVLVGIFRLAVQP
jgi:hypothetical protein